MSKVIAYKNTDRLCFCQIQFDSKERVLVSIANVPQNSIKVIKLLAGVIPYKTIWEFSAVTAGEKDAYNRLIAMFIDQTDTRSKHPLDAMIKELLPFKSCNEAARALLRAEEEASRNT